MIERFQIPLDEAGNQILHDYVELKESLLLNFLTSNPSSSPSSPLISRSTRLQASQPTAIRPHSAKPEDILNAEADAILDIAEDELHEGLKQSAARNFHAASVFYRVLGISPSLSLNYADIYIHGSCF